MRDEQLRTFIAIAKAGSFTRAAEYAYITKQPMFKQISTLEDEVGCPLFIRSKAGAELTDAGKIFLKGAEKILKEREKLITECRRLTHNEVIRIGSVEHQVILDPVNVRFGQLYPEVRIQRIVHPNHSGEFRVANDIMDVGETFRKAASEDPYPFVYTPLTKIPYYAAMSKDHPLAGKKSVSLNQLRLFPVHYSSLMMEQEYAEKLQESFRGKEEKLTDRMDVDSQVEAAFQCAHGAYIMITANPFIFSVEGLKTIPLSEGWFREYGIITRFPVPDIIQKYVDTAVEVYRNKNS